MSFIQNLFTSRDNNANANTYVGQQDRIWWDPVTNAFYYSDGNTAGGILISGGSSGNGTVGGTNTQVQFNNAGNFGGDPNFTFNSSTSTLTVTNIVANSITGGAGGSNTQVLFNDGGNIAGNAKFTFNKISGNATLTGTASLGNVFPTANNVSNIGTSTNRFYDLWLGSGNINLIDDILNINQEINASDGNLVITGGNGLKFGQFAIYGNTISTINPTANINIGLAGSTGYVDINRPLAVNSTGGGAPAFLVETTGVTEIRSYGNIMANTALLLVNGSTAGTGQARNFEGTLIQATAQDNTPGRMSADAFGVDGTGQNAYVSWAARVARGNVTTPSQTQAGDTMFRFTSQGYSNSGAYIPSIVRYNQVALENFATGQAGTRHNFAATPVGTATIKNIANIDGNGITFSSLAAGGPANIGITFQDGSYQNTAYISTSVVRSLTAGAGISLSSATGNIIVTNTGVLGIVGTANQISVTGNVGNVVTLGTPQDIGPTSNVQFNNLTVTNLSVIGNISNVIPSIVSGKIVYVANTANSFTEINTSGLVTGNVGNSVWAGILYNTTSNTWVMDIGNSVGITSDIIYATNIISNANLHVGNASNDYDFPNALIQGDINIDGYGQFVMKNHAQTANSSADIVAVANNGDDSNFYIDMGINSNVYANTDYTVTKANDGYLYVNGGNLVIGTQTAGKVINFFTGGTSASSFIRGTLSDTGLSMVGNVTANNMISTNATIGGTVSATGNITGGNLLIPAGSITASGNINGLGINGTTISATANVVAGNVRTAGQVSAAGNVTAGNLLVPVGVANIGNITTSNITAGNITSAIISATGNITGPNIEATLLTVSSILSVSGNITGGNLLTNGVISTSANISGNYFIGNGSQLTGISLARISNGTSNVAIATASGNATIGIGGTPNVAVFATTGAYIIGLISATGNILTTANVSGGNLLTSGLISAAGTITGTTIAGSTLSSTGNVNTVGIVGTGNISTSGNISGGNLLAAGLSLSSNVLSTINSTANITTTANISGGNILGGANVNATTHTGTTVSVTANVTGGNILTGGIVSATGNISGNYFLGNGSQLTGIATTNSFSNVLANGTAVLATSGTSVLTVTPGNNQVITGNNTSKSLTIAVNDNPAFANVSATGNITAANFIGNIISANNISNIGNVFVQGNIQYNLATDDGGNVTQLTNKATAVTCNGRTGRITMSGAALTGGSVVTFTVNNTYVQQYDLIILNMKDPIRANTYASAVAGVGVNNFNIQIQNVDNNSHSDAIVLSFAVIQVR